MDLMPEVFGLMWPPGLPARACYVGSNIHQYHNASRLFHDRTASETGLSNVVKSMASCPYYNYATDIDMIVLKQVVKSCPLIFSLAANKWASYLILI